MQEIRIKIEDEIPYGIALNLVEKSLNEIEEHETFCVFKYTFNDGERISVHFKRRRTLSFYVCKTR